MNRFTKLTAGALMLAAAATATPAMAQDNTSSTSMFKAPIFVLQPGALTVNAISAPNNGAKSKTYFNARFATVVPTASPWLSLVAGAQVQPGNGEARTPALFYGGIIPIAPLSTATNGMLGLSIDPLGVTTAGGSKNPNFVLEGALSLAIGKMFMENMGPTWAGTGLYFLLDQQIGRNDYIDVNGVKQTDNFAPALLYGISIPVGHGS
jgi:hypothetical protein